MAKVLDTGMNADFAQSINQYRGASYGEVLIVVSKSIRVRRGPWNYAYMSDSHIKPSGRYIV